MLNRRQRRSILAKSIKKSMDAAWSALDAARDGQDVRSNLSALAHAFHHVKTDAQVADADALARFLGDVERAMEAARDKEQPLEWDLVDAAIEELRRVRATVAAGLDIEIEPSLVASFREAGVEARRLLRGDRVRSA